MALLANAASLQRLTSLSLPEEPLGHHPGEAVALGRAKGLANLTALSLAGSRLRADGLQALAPFHRLPHLRSLDLSDNGIDDVTGPLVAHLPLKCLEALALGTPFSGMSGAGVAALASSPHLGALTKLVLSGHRVQSAGARALLTTRKLRSLKRLYLNSCGVTDDDVREMVRLPGARRLTELHLCNNEISDEGVKAIAASPLLANLEALDLGSGGWGDEGALALAASPHLGKLTALNTVHTQITEKGRAAIRERFGVWA